MESAYFLFHGRYDNFGCMNKLTLTNCSFDFPTSMSSDPSIYIMDCLFGVVVGVRMNFGSFIMSVEREGECTSFSSTISLLFGGLNGGIEVILLTLKHSNLNSSHLFHPSLLLFRTLLNWILQHVAIIFRKYLMSDDQLNASELRKRYHRGGTIPDSDLSASQLRGRYGIENNGRTYCNRLIPI